MKSLPAKCLNISIKRDRFGSIEFDPLRSLLVLKWFHGAEGIPVRHFKDNLTILADTILEKETSGVLVDIREGNPHPSILNGTWAFRNVIPKFNQIIKRVAWLSDFNQGLKSRYGEPFIKTGEPFQTCWFRDESNAIEWILVGG